MGIKPGKVEINMKKIVLSFVYDDDGNKTGIMLTNKEFNYGKEFARNNLVFYGGSIYFNILLHFWANARFFLIFK